MKNLFVAMALVALMFSSCGTKDKSSNNNVHTHADGTMHEGMDHDTPQQEAFEVPDEGTGCCAENKKACTSTCDSTTSCSAKTEQTISHDHDHGHDHAHE